MGTFFYVTIDTSHFPSTRRNYKTTKRNENVGQIRRVSSGRRKQIATTCFKCGKQNPNNKSNGAMF